ncbi:MAG: hypothetical protein WKG07_27785 [Hymenobacter sp.]
MELAHQRHQLADAAAARSRRWSFAAALRMAKRANDDFGGAKLS